MKKILVPIDFSENAQKALSFVGGVLEGIQTYCHQAQVDMLILCRRDKNLLQLLLNGPGLAHKLALSTDVPLLVCHLRNDE